MMEHGPSIREFHRRFGFLYLSRVEPSAKDIEKDYISNRGTRIAHLSYWDYFLGVSEFNTSADFDKIWNLGGEVVTMIGSK